MPPFDINRPNEHETKADFNAELAVVTKSLEQVTSLIDTMLVNAKQDDGVAPEIQRLSGILNRKLRENAAGLEVSSASDLVRQNLAEAGGYTTFLMVLLDMQLALQDRARELEDQKSKFWNLSYRAPDYFARFLALNLARLYCQQVGAIPTYGTSGETGEPSTDFCRALKEVYAVLDHEVNEREHARWAVSQLTERDVETRQEGLLGSLVGMTLRETEEETLAALTRSAGRKSLDG
ncbi:hypothetical protein [Marivita hallyeonensis]|uniref:hypothetical protein n=1 Tax=Marivita hallyeonensis TaxID=996342 RepID=UPI0011603F8D|nr:hypothetical protein [Marivita hallyeonensis]